MHGVTNQQGIFFMEKIILVAGILSILLSILALYSGKRTNDAASFGALCLITGVWIFSNLFSLWYAMEYPIVLRLTYAFGSLTVAALLAWSFLYDETFTSRFLPVAAYGIGSIMAFLSLLNGMVVGTVRSVSIQGVDVDQGPFFLFFSGYLFFALSWSVINVFHVYRQSDGYRKRQARLVLTGISGSLLIMLFVSGILPAFGIFSFTNLDSPSSLIFILFSIAAVVKHRFFESKIILTQMLVAVLVTISVIQLSNSETLENRIINLAAFVTVFIVGIFLVKSVLWEVEQKEKFQDMASRLVRANEELRQLDTAKSEFISIASHQLRAPLSTVKGYISLMLEGSYGAVNTRFQDALNNVYLVNKRLIQLVEDLLNISRIESGCLAYTYTPSRLEPLVSELVDMFLVIAKSRKLSLTLVLPKESLPEMRLDERKIYEAISNLVDNALKYTKEGSVTVFVEQGDTCARLIVEDTGIGITPEDMPRLFEKFIRSMETSVIDVSGTGLGLYVSRNFIETHGGTLRAESEGLGKGARFIVELPFINPRA